MSVYLVTRSHYEGPAVKSVRRSEESSVLEWFQVRWGRETPEDRDDLHLFLWDREEDEWPACPESAAQLARVLKEYGGTQGDILFSESDPHVLQALDDDDELEFAYYLFDGTFLAAHAADAAFLLTEDWRLPESVTPEATLDTALRNPAEQQTLPLAPQGSGEGTVYFIPLAYYDSGNLSDLEGPDDFSGPYRIDGIRLPDLPAYLTETTPESTWPFELLLLRTQAPGSLAEMLERAGHLPVVDLSEGLDGEAWQSGIEEAQSTLATALADRAPRGGRAQGTLSQVQASPHLAQLCLHTDTWGIRELFHRWIFFDDLWLAAHPDLGATLLRYAIRWDVLTQD